MVQTGKLAEALRMTHLAERPQEVESIEELKKSVEETVRTKVEADASLAPDPRDQERWPFHFDWVDARKKRWEGDFVNEILTIAEQQYSAVLRSRLAGGQPFDSLDPTMSTINLAVSHMTYSLKIRPDWAKDLLRLRDPSLVIALWDKVSSHEVRFFRFGEAESQGEEKR